MGGGGVAKESRVECFPLLGGKQNIGGKQNRVAPLEHGLMVSINCWTPKGVALFCSCFFVDLSVLV